MSKADGQLIAIRFTEEITSDASTCDIDAFSVTGQEYNMEPGGELISGDYEVSAVEDHSEYIRYEEVFGGSKTNTTLNTAGALCLTSSQDPDEYGIIFAGAPSLVRAAREVGMRFTVGASDINVGGLRIMAPTARTANAHLWRASDQALLGTVSIVASAGAWSSGNFSAPITLAAGESYVVSYYATPSWYYNGLASNSFNSAITVAGPSAGVTANAYPAAEEAAYIYGLADIIITSPPAYAASGTYESGPIDVSSLTADLRIKGIITSPPGTTVTLQYATGATQGAWQSIALDDSFSPCTNVWLKVTLATSDATVTPSISSLRLQDAAAPPRTILLTLNPLKRFHRVNGNLTVSYDSTIGNLAGASGPVASFSLAFIPAELVNKPHPNDAENIEIVSATVAGTLTEIFYTNTKEDENIEISGVTVTGALTHINDL